MTFTADDVAEAPLPPGPPPPMPPPGEPPRSRQEIEDAFFDLLLEKGVRLLGEADAAIFTLACPIRLVLI